MTGLGLPLTLRDSTMLQYVCPRDFLFWRVAISVYTDNMLSSPCQALLLNKSPSYYLIKAVIDLPMLHNIFCLHYDNCDKSVYTYSGTAHSL